MITRHATRGMNSSNTRCRVSSLTIIKCCGHYSFAGSSNRPRRLYVVVNPHSGKGHACRTWFRVESMFSDAMIKTDVVCKFRKFLILN